MNFFHFSFNAPGLLNGIKAERIKTDYIAFPDLMTYSYIKKIEPQNKFATKKTAK